MESKGLGYTLSEPHANFPTQLLSRGSDSDRDCFHHASSRKNVLC
jgi:hypothetical protein